MTPLTATPAHAAEVWASGGTVTVKVVTGGKNYSNRTQWVSSITVLTNTSANNSYGCGTFEGWTQGFYARVERCDSVHFYISRWVGSGNYVCGAFQDIDRRWNRSIACIAIRV
ncbi:MAG TPA: hypothetical protein VNA20_05635 [Frankiaceae bacterium]|nr:hypothetical protein [Frankiaceae bacterium]